jgi:hypothetical protein
MVEILYHLLLLFLLMVLRNDRIVTCGLVIGIFLVLVKKEEGMIYIDCKIGCSNLTGVFGIGFRTIEE